MQEQCVQQERGDKDSKRVSEGPTDCTKSSEELCRRHWRRKDGGTLVEPRVKVD